MPPPAWQEEHRAGPHLDRLRIPGQLVRKTTGHKLCELGGERLARDVPHRWISDVPVRSQPPYLASLHLNDESLGGIEVHVHSAALPRGEEARRDSLLRKAKLRMESIDPFSECRRG